MCGLSIYFKYANSGIPVAICDNNGNVCEFSHYQNNPDKAELALLSLVNCHNMTNSSNSYNSKGCKEVNGARNSYYCYNSSNLIGCVRVKNSRNLIKCSDVNHLHDQENVHGKISVWTRIKLEFNKIARKCHWPELFV